MRSRFVIVNAIVVALAIAAWRVGLFDAFPDLGNAELMLVGALFVYAAIGFVAAWCGRFETARHMANSLPVWALGCTGLGMLLAVAQLHSLTPEAMARVFRDLAFAITPNIAGVALMAWLRELLWWAAGEET